MNTDNPISVKHMSDVTIHEQVKKFVFDFFLRKGEIPGKTEEEKLHCDYLYSALIDSMGVIDMVGEIEDHFKIRFSSDDFENPNFRIMGGLIQMIVIQIEANS